MKGLLLGLAACLAGAAMAAEGKVVQFAPGPEVEQAVQEAFILEDPGTVFEFAEGTYTFTGQLSLDLADATVRGAGMDKTIFDFKGQTSGSEGLYVTSDGVTVRDLAILDTPGNCFKSNGADNLRLINVRTEWTGGPKETNGAYGLYPVSCENVLIDGCVAIGASDAGIYVGQTKNVIVRNSRAEYNVAGIEIENCHYADVYDCIATRNTGGILVFDLPGLPMQKGRYVRVFNNKVVKNDTPNFAPAGNIVANVPTGTGIMIMANSHVEIFHNEIGDNGTANVSIVSYLVTRNQISDPEYYPYPEAIYIHNNSFGPSGFAPKGELALAAAIFLGGKLPDIIWDGIVNEEKTEDGNPPAEMGIYIEENTKKDGGEVTFANLDAGTFLKDPTKMKVKQDISAHAGSLPRLDPVKLSGLE
jgi:parallel beta-helix repeat protein